MKLLIVDDHPLFNIGLAAALASAQSDVKVASANTLQEGMLLAESFGPDIVLLDYYLHGTNGLEALDLFGSNFPLIARIVISGDERGSVESLARAHGASGFISKALPLEVIWRAIGAVMQGGEWWAQAKNGVDLHAITLRQREVLQLLAKGRSNKEIAQALGITERTVKMHVSDLLARSGGSNRIQLLNLARDRRWLL
jgi:DNA-binding NarL/FixJ family response regulator